MNMKKWLLFPISLFLLGIIFLAYGMLSGEVTVGLVVFIPFVMSTGIFGFLGIMSLFLSMLSLFFVISLYPPHYVQSPSETSYDQEKESINQVSGKKIHTGGVIFIGPIPIVFGSNQKITKYMLLASIIILFLFVLYASLLLNE